MSVVKNTLIGCGDNDLHYMSQSRCCCGVDTIGEAFNNYLKYNQGYFSTSKNLKEEIKNIYVPSCSVSSCLNPDTRLNNISDFKTYTDYYCCKKCDMFNNINTIEYFNSLDFDGFSKNNRKNYILCNGNNINFEQAKKYIEELLTKDNKYTDIIICGSDINEYTIWNDVADFFNLKTIPLYHNYNNKYNIIKKNIPKTFNLIALNQRIINDLTKLNYIKRIKNKEFIKF